MVSGVEWVDLCYMGPGVAWDLELDWCSMGSVVGPILHVTCDRHGVLVLDMGC